MRYAPWVLVVVAVALYAGSLPAPFIYDDAVSIVENESIRSLWPPGDVLAPPRGTPVAGRPVVNLSLAVNYAIGGLDVVGYRALNVAVHVLAALVLYGILRRTLPDGVALACALIWMVHPVQTESVVYVTQRTESMMALLYLLTLYAAIRAGEAGRPGRRWMAVSVIACTLGMATKESMVTAPLVVVLYDWAFRARPFAEVARQRMPLYLCLASTWIVLAAIMATGPRSTTIGFAHGVGPWE